MVTAIHHAGLEHCHLTVKPLGQRVPMALPRRKIHGGNSLTRVQEKRLKAVGLPMAFTLAVFAWLHSLGALVTKDYDGVEFFAGCCSYSNACRRRGFTMSGAERLFCLVH